MKNITQEEINSFVQLLFDEAYGIKEYGHSLCSNSHETAEIRDTMFKIKLLLEELHIYITESYEL